MPNECAGILIVDDHPVVRAGLASMFNTYQDMRVLGSVPGGSEALAFVRTCRPDLVLLDLRLVNESGLDVLTALKLVDPTLPVIMLSSFETPEDVFQAMQRGASGYVLKSSTEEELIASVRRVRDGKKHFSQGIAESLSERLSSTSLTAREVEVLRMVARGLSNKEVASLLYLSSNTVRNHLNHLMEKLGATDRTEAVVKAMKQGIVSLD